MRPYQWRLSTKKRVQSQTQHGSVLMSGHMGALPLRLASSSRPPSAISTAPLGPSTPLIYASTGRHDPRSIQKDVGCLVARDFEPRRIGGAEPRGRDSVLPGHAWGDSVRVRATPGPWCNHGVCVAREYENRVVGAVGGGVADCWLSKEEARGWRASYLPRGE